VAADVRRLPPNFKSQISNLKLFNPLPFVWRY